MLNNSTSVALALTAVFGALFSFDVNVYDWLMILLITITFVMPVISVIVGFILTKRAERYVFVRERRWEENKREHILIFPFT